jgi:hypothetical protein
MVDSQTTVVIVTVVAILAVVVWFDAGLLADLAGTPDYALNYFPRQVWALIIVLSFPIGPMLYLLLAKHPRRR